MSTEVDQRVVEMRFDNAQFEKNIKQSLRTLQELKKNTDMKDVVKGINEIEKSLNNFSLKNVSAAITNGIKEFGLLGVAGFTAFQRISNAAIDAAKQIANTVGELQSMKAGFREYETQINAVQTILSNTASKGTTIDDVNRALDELNEYADKTIYNFTQMTDSVGKFTATGVGLEDSVAAIKGISNLAAISGSDAAQASRAMYNLSQALAMGKLQLMDWNSVVNAGMGGEIFQESLKETARVHGVMVDQIIEEEGSFRDSLQKGWITAEILTETLQKFTGDLSDEQLRSLGYTEEQIVAITDLGQRAKDAATQVKTFTQLFDTLNEARQSGWTQTWEIIIGDFYEARDLLTEISNIFSGIINEQAEKRNSFLEAVLGPRGGGKDIKKQGEETVAALNASREEIQRVVDEIWNGAWGNGEERWAALAEAGYDPVLIQSLVDLTEATENNQIDWENLTEEQLRSVGASDEQIEAFRQLNGEMLQNIQNTEDLTAAEAEADNRVSGRQLLIDSLMNILHGLMDIFGEIGKAWEEVFPPMSADTVYDMIVKFEELTEKFKLNEGQLNAIRIGFKGLFDAIGLVGDVFGSFWQIIKNVFGMLGGGEGEKGLTFLQKFATLGSKLSGFRKALKDGQKFEHFVKMTTDRIAQFIDFVKELKNVLKNLFGGDDEQRANAFEKLAEWADKLKQKIKSISFKPIAKIIEKVQGFLKDKGISFEWLDNLRSKMENMSIGGVLDKIKERFNNLTANLGIDDFHPIQTIVGWIEQLTGLDIPDFETIKANVGAKITEIVGWFKYDEETGTVPIVEKVKEWVENFKTITFTSWNTLVVNVKNKITKIKSWFLGDDVTGEPGIVGRIKAWIENFKTITFTAWNTLVENVKNKITAIKNWFLGNQFTGEPGVVGRIKAWIEKITGIEAPSFETISSGIINAISDIKEAFAGDDITGEPEVIKNIKAWFTDITGIEVPSFDDLIGNIKGALSKIKDAFLGNDITGEPGILGKLTGWLNDITGFDISSFSFEGLISDIQTKFEEIKSLFSGDDIDGDKPGILSKIESAFKSIKGWFETTFNTDDISKIIPGYDIFKKIITKIQGILAWLTTGDTSGLGDDEQEKVVNGSFDAGVVGDYKHARLALPSMRSDRVKLPNEEGYTAILSQAEELKGPLEIIKEAFEELQKWFEKFDIKAAYDTFKTNVIEVVDSVKEWFNGIATKFQGTSIGAKLTAKFDAVKNAFLNFDFSEAYTKFHDKFMAKVDTIKGWFATVKDKFNFHPIEAVQASIETIQKWWEDLNINNGQGESPIQKFFGKIKETFEEFGSSPFVEKALELIQKLPGILTLFATGAAVYGFKKFLGEMSDALLEFIDKLGGGGDSWDKKANAILKVSGAIGIVALAIGYLASTLGTVSELAENDDGEIDEATKIIYRLSGLLGAMSIFSGKLVEYQGKTGEITKGTTTKNITKGTFFQLGDALSVAGGFGMMETAKAIEIVAQAYATIVDVVKDPNLDPDDLERAGKIISGLATTLTAMGAFQSVQAEIGIGKFNAMFKTAVGIQTGAGDTLMAMSINVLWNTVKSVLKIVDDPDYSDAKIDRALDIVERLTDFLKEISKWSHIGVGVGAGSKWIGLNIGTTASSGFGAWEYSGALRNMVAAVKELAAIDAEDVTRATNNLNDIMVMFGIGSAVDSLVDSGADLLTDTVAMKENSKALSVLLKDGADIKSATKSLQKLSGTGGFFNSAGVKDLTHGAELIMFADALSKVADAMSKLGDVHVEHISEQMGYILAPFAAAAVAGAVTNLLMFGGALSSLGTGLLFLGAGGIVNGIAKFTETVTGFLEFLIEHGEEAETVLPMVRQISRDVTSGMVEGFLSDDALEKYEHVGDEIGLRIGNAIGNNILETAGLMLIDFILEMANMVDATFLDIGSTFDFVDDHIAEAQKNLLKQQTLLLETGVKTGFKGETYEAQQAAVAAAQAELERVKDYVNRGLNPDEILERPEGDLLAVEGARLYLGMPLDIVIEQDEQGKFIVDGESYDDYDSAFAAYANKATVAFQEYVEKNKTYDAPLADNAKGANAAVNAGNLAVYFDTKNSKYVCVSDQGKEIMNDTPEGLFESLMHIYSAEFGTIWYGITNGETVIPFDVLLSARYTTEKYPVDPVEMVNPADGSTYLSWTETRLTEEAQAILDLIKDSKPVWSETEEIEGLWPEPEYTTHVAEEYVKQMASELIANKDKLAAASTEATEEVNKAAETTLGIGSPSSVAKEYAMWYDEGLGQGLTENSDIPKAAVTQVTDEMVSVSASEMIKLKFFNAAMNCVYGLADGFRSGSSVAVEAARQTMQDAINAAEQTAGIASPSKVFARIGMYSDLGLAQGFIKYIPDVVHAVNETGQTAIDTLYNAMVSPVNDLYDDFDLYPNITPIVDLHNIQNANQLLSRSFGITTGDLMEESRALKSQFDNSLYYEAYDDSGVIGAIMGLNDRLNQLDSSISNMSMVLDSGALVGQLTPRVDKQLGTIARRKARGV